MTDFHATKFINEFLCVKFSNQVRLNADQEQVAWAPTRAVISRNHADCAFILIMQGVDCVITQAGCVISKEFDIFAQSRYDFVV